MENRKAGKKMVTGTVISNKMNKVITVQWTVRKKHPFYKKFVVRHGKLKARDEKNEAAEGDVVRVVESRPLSKSVRWKMVEIVEKAPEKS